MTKIAILIPTLDQIGGAEKQALILAKELAQRDWQVTLITLSGDGLNVREDLSKANVALLALKMRKAWVDPSGWFRYLSWARIHRPDILHAHLPHATWFARCVRLLSPVRVVLDTIHTARPPSLGKRLVYRLTQKLGNHTTCVSQAAADSSLAARILPLNRYSILHNGVQTPHSSLPSCTEFTQFQWIAVGRLAPVKDYPTLLRAFTALPLNPQARLTIVGTGPEEENLKRLAATLQAKQTATTRIEFAGFHADVQPFLANAQAFVLTSLWEGLPMSAIEAHFAGLPIVATDAQGTREAVDSPRSAILTPPGDIESLTSAMLKIMQLSPAQLCEMGANGRRFVEDHFSLPVIMDQWESLYRQLLQAQLQPSRLARSDYERNRPIHREE